LNETLCRALIRARLTEEDVAARLQVDPKTVRRWLEGRVPYLRHRWGIAAMLGVDETDLWPQLRTTRSRPDEVLAIYPHRDTVPRDVWLRLFGSAQHEIGILDDSDMPVAADQDIGGALAERAESEVNLRICLSSTQALAGRRSAASSDSGYSTAATAYGKLVSYGLLHGKGKVEVRLCRGPVYNSIYYADDQLLVSQRVYGFPSGSAPVLHLQHAEGNDMVAAYFSAFENTWSSAMPVC
jgi:transcriptional regulator with XRE-family HTH domain